MPEDNNIPETLMGKPVFYSNFAGKLSEPPLKMGIYPREIKSMREVVQYGFHALMSFRVDFPVMSAGGITFISKCYVYPQHPDIPDTNLVGTMIETIDDSGKGSYILSQSKSFENDDPNKTIYGVYSKKWDEE